MIKIKILADSKYPVDRKKIRADLKEVLARHNIVDNCELGVMIVGKRKMAELNEKYMSKKGPTDVLSFPIIGEENEFVSSPDGILRLGDIVVCYPVAMDYALRRQMLMDRVISELIEHGCLHLLGIHHR